MILTEKNLSLLTNFLETLKNVFEMVVLAAEVIVDYSFIIFIKTMVL